MTLAQAQAQVQALAEALWQASRPIIEDGSFSISRTNAERRIFFTQRDSIRRRRRLDSRIQAPPGGGSPTTPFPVA